MAPSGMFPLNLRSLALFSCRALTRSRPQRTLCRYFPQALELNKHNKYFLMDDSYERAATLGFRCVEDVKANTSGPSSLDCRPSDDDPLCARLVDSRGYIDLTADTANGGDWMHFGDDIQDPSYITKKSKRSDKVLHFGSIREQPSPFSLHGFCSLTERLVAICARKKL